MSSFIFKYHPDNIIYYKGVVLYTFAEFVEKYSTFPIIENDFFEYSETKFVHINDEGHDVLGGGAKDQPIIAAINSITKELTDKYNSLIPSV